mmetsp:Transcript_12373/g.35388  ORF Transcript_12373/g.35388 Transcript_12373/m.35388 type:complete len:367 (+) Transcript_12373:151-1251(+)
MECRVLNSFAELFFDDDNVAADADAEIERLRREMKIDETEEDNAKGRGEGEPAIEVPTGTSTSVFDLTFAEENDNHSSEAAEEAILACRSGGSFDDLDNADAAKIVDADDEKTVDTAPLDTTQDSSVSASSNTCSGTSSDDAADNSKSSPNATKSVGRSRSYVSSLQNLTTNLTAKSDQLRELDTYLVSWQSRRTCKLSDPRAAAQYDESVEITAVDITLTEEAKIARREERETRMKKRGEDPPEEDPDAEENEEENKSDEAEGQLTPEEREWNDGYESLAAYYRQYGTTSGCKDYEISQWIDQQRKAAKENKLRQEQIVRLVAIEFSFGNGSGKVPLMDDKAQQEVEQDDEDEEEEDNIAQCASF